MTVPADIRGEIVRLRTEGMTFPRIAMLLHQPISAVVATCRTHFFDEETRARAQLRAEVAAARREWATAPLYRPARGLT